MDLSSDVFITLCPHCNLPYALPHDCCGRCGHPMACDDASCRSQLPMDVRPSAVALKDWLRPEPETVALDLNDLVDVDQPV
ncbi:hypothetical protein [Longibacter sp.]|uniref:hypothetical protein n=1 Tax=Longibacter sp. TaxID=2045415 RepID=UPI001E005B13|nr:hypothetical protein [Bacteroidota bacterium]